MRTTRPRSAPADSTQVDVDVRTDINYWTRVLGVTEDALRAAVKRVGPLANDVRAELRRRR